jgi:hypothetical protein
VTLLAVIFLVTVEEGLRCWWSWAWPSSGIGRSLRSWMVRG